MAERKVLQKYYPPDFDPAALERKRAPKTTGLKQQVVRLMAPFSMKCTSCGEYIYKGRKFNARKETTEEKYYAITIFRFYIRCTRCSAEITFKTDPKHMDYSCEKGAKRNFEVWRADKLAEETDEERLDRVAKEEEERDAMKDLEKKTSDAKTEMAVADALDEVRMMNATRELASGYVMTPMVEKAEEGEGEREMEEEARRAFQTRRIFDIEIDEPTADSASFQPQVKKKVDYSALLGIKKGVTGLGMDAYDSD
ncbi:hypothetical protein LTR08_007368 [Meristemomyces frigidus]|nr:hypothetical protein LTR08_007368 [Meristemomyces frigidus]